MYITVVINEITKENSTNAKIPTTFTDGISNQLLENPSNIKAATLKPGTTSVTRYSAIAEEIHLNRLNVTMFRGRSKRLMIGFARIEAPVRPAPANNMVITPCSKISPLMNPVTKYRVMVFTTK